MRLSLLGKKFGRLSPKRYRRVKPVNKQPYSVWLCLCDCGAELEVRTKDLQDGKSLSCGCLRRELATTHGLNAIGLRDTFKAMDKRCNDRLAKDYANYGGRGIQLCMTAKEFANWCRLNPRPTADYQIDRVDNTGDYCVNNIQWATKKQQQRNKRSNRLVEAWGISKTLAEWVELSGLNYILVHKRLQAGWSAEQALATAVGCAKEIKPICLLKCDNV